MIDNNTVYRLYGYMCNMARVYTVYIYVCLPIYLIPACRGTRLVPPSRRRPNYCVTRGVAVVFREVSHFLI